MFPRPYVYTVLCTLVAPLSCLPQQNDAPVPSVCNPLMPLERFEVYSALKNACICSANAQYNACVDRAFAADDMDEYLLCEVRQCQNYNLCELVVPCAQTLVPGLQVQDCGVTDHDYPDLSTKSWLHDPVGGKSAGVCVGFAAVDMSGVGTLKKLRSLLVVLDDVTKSNVAIGDSP